jgi:hypothetical protein
VNYPPELRSIFPIRRSLCLELIAYLQQYGSDEEYATGLVKEIYKVLEGRGAEETSLPTVFLVDKTDSEGTK